MVAILYQYRKYFIPSLLIFFFAVFYSRFLFDYPGTSGDSIKFQYLGLCAGRPSPIRISAVYGVKLCFFSSPHFNAGFPFQSFEHGFLGFYR